MALWSSMRVTLKLVESALRRICVRLVLSQFPWSPIPEESNGRRAPGSRRCNLQLEVLLVASSISQSELT
jgi:hypothetical protein